MRSDRFNLKIKAAAAALAVLLVFTSLAACTTAGGGSEGADPSVPGSAGSDGPANGGRGKDGGASGGSASGDASGPEEEAVETWGGEGSDIAPVEADGDVFGTLGARPGDLSCGGYSVADKDGTLYIANISGSGTITRITPDGKETVICDIEPWDEMRKVTRMNLWDGILYFEIGPVFNYTLYFATYHYPINGLYRLDLSWADEYMKHYEAGEEGYEDLPEPVSVIQDVGAMGASYAEIAYYDPLIRDGKLYYWVNNDYKKGRQLYRADLGGENAELIYDSADKKVISWTADDKNIYISDEGSIFLLDQTGEKRLLEPRNGGKWLQRYGKGLYYADGGRICRIMVDGSYETDTMVERDGTINGFNVSGGKIYLIEELGTEGVSSYIGAASGPGPDDTVYLFRYMADPEFAGDGNIFLKGPCVAGDRLFYIQSFKDPNGKEYGDVSYAELDVENGEFREVRTGKTDD